MAEQPPSYLVLIILMQVDTTLLRLPPMFGHTLIYICLVYYLRYQLWHVVDQGRVGSGNLGAVDGICRAIFYEESEKSEDAVDEEDNDEAVDYEENGEAATHGYGNKDVKCVQRGHLV